MSDEKNRRILPVAPVHLNNPATAALPRLDDEHRGPMVSEAHELSSCCIDLMETYRRRGLSIDAARKEVTGRISYAMRTGALPIWVAPKDGPEKLVEPRSMIEIERATVESGCYIPKYDNGWLFGRPLFVKKDDWVQFIEQIQGAPSQGQEPVINGKAIKGRGRTKGTGFQRADAPLLDKMQKAIDGDPSLNAASAAKLFADQAKGASFDAIADRLARRFRAGRNGE